MPKWGGQFGPANGQWKGGRVVDPRGYVLIRVGVGHPLADCRGYAYEHRIEAEKKLGRPLRSGEQVHHERAKDDQEHIKVARSFAEHREFEGKRNYNHRVLGEPNPNILCACGCGVALSKFDNFGRPRQFISGHNMRKANG